MTTRSTMETATMLLTRTILLLFLLFFNPLTSEGRSQIEVTKASPRIFRSLFLIVQSDAKRCTPDLISALQLVVGSCATYRRGKTGCIPSSHVLLLVGHGRDGGRSGPDRQNEFPPGVEGGFGIESSPGQQQCVCGLLRFCFPRRN